MFLHPRERQESHFSSSALTSRADQATRVLGRNTQSTNKPPPDAGRCESMNLVTITPHKPTLILWDIDHTLVTIGEVSREIYEAAFGKFFGEPLRELADMTGQTEQAILTETLVRHGVSNAESKLRDFYATLAQAVDQLYERMRSVGRRLPGAREGITALANNGVVQTVVTGNIKPIAATKLKIFHLSQYLDLDIGGYGSDGDTRPSLIRQAWKRAQQKYADYRQALSTQSFDSAAQRQPNHPLGAARH